MSLSENIKVTFKIKEVNNARKIRTEYFIKVEVFENDIYDGWYWQSPKLIKSNIKGFGEESYLNAKDYPKLFKELKTLK